MPINNVEIGHAATIADRNLVNMYRCSIGRETSVGYFVEIQKNSSVGARCVIESNAFICEGVNIGDDVRIGHGVVFTNDRYPRAVTGSGELLGDADWEVIPTLVRDEAVIGSNAAILCGLTIGRGAIVACGSTVTRDVPDHAIVAGVPAQIVSWAHPAHPIPDAQEVPSAEVSR